MSTQYFRITAYDPKHDIPFIIDSNGMFEKLWQFSSFVISKGYKVLEVSTDEKFLDINIEKAKVDKNHILLRASQHAKPNYLEKTIDCITHKVIKVEGKQYILK